MKKLYEKWEPQIREYFTANKLNYAKVQKCGKMFGVLDRKKTLYFQDIESSKDIGLLDDTPAPIVLKVFEDNEQLIFEETIYTKEYFK